MIKVYCLRFKGKVVYIGQTKNLKIRISQHKRDKDFDVFSVLHEVESVKEAKYLEDKYISKYDPKYNKMLNNGGVYDTLRNFSKIHRIKESDLKSWVVIYEITPAFKNKFLLKELEHPLLEAFHYGSPTEKERKNNEYLRNAMGDELFEKLIIKGGLRSGE